MRLLARSSVDELFDLRGKRVIVTGAARGNGRAIADGFAAAGCRVFYVDRMFAEDSSSYEPIIGHTEIGADITDQDALADLMRIAGDVDVLVNNAGITLSGKQEGQDSWAETLAVNLTGAFRITELVIDGMKRSGGGSIINITSMSKSGSIDVVKYVYHDMDNTLLDKADALQQHPVLTLQHVRVIHARIVCGSLRTLSKHDRYLGAVLLMSLYRELRLHTVQQTLDPWRRELDWQYISAAFWTTPTWAR